MSTEFTSTTTGQVGFVRFFGGPERGACFEFGTMSQFERVCEAMRNGDTFVPESCQGDLPGDPTTVDEMERAVVDGRVTFGEFPVTVEVGSGMMFDFTVEQ